MLASLSKTNGNIGVKNWADYIKRIIRFYIVKVDTKYQ